MPHTVIHLAVADRTYEMLGSSVIKNAPLFFSGNLAPDAIHARKGYQRADKKRTHLCEGGISLYGFGYPEKSDLFNQRLSLFIDEYCNTHSEYRDLYLGYAAHLLTDEIYSLEVCKSLEEHLKCSGTELHGAELRKNIVDNIDNIKEYDDFFTNYHDTINSMIPGYPFKQNIVDVLEAVWDYEVPNYVTADEINRSKRWVINRYSSRILSDMAIACKPYRKRSFRPLIEFVDLAANSIILRLNLALQQ